MIIGKNLKRIREGMGISSPSLAKYIDVGEPYYWDIEEGKTMMTAYELYQAARFLMVPVSTLLKDWG